MTLSLVYLAPILIIFVIFAGVLLGWLKHEVKFSKVIVLGYSAAASGIFIGLTVLGIWIFSF